MFLLLFASAFSSVKAVLTGAEVTRIKTNNPDGGHVYSNVLQGDYYVKENPTLKTNNENEIWSPIMDVNGVYESINNFTMKFSPKELILDEEKGRKLKYKTAGLHFLMKRVLTKIIMGILLPLGILISKILSWKAVSLSLMTFILVKILFFKNLLTTGVVPAAYTTPCFVQNSPNDIWKRQNELPPSYHWNSS